MKHISTRILVKQILSCREQEWDDMPLSVLRHVVELEEALRVSKLCSHQKEEINTKHKKKQDRIIRCNGCVRIPIETDGNCMFNSIVYLLEGDITAMEMCFNVAQHIEKNPNLYMPFVKFRQKLICRGGPKTRPAWKCALMEVDNM